MVVEDRQIAAQLLGCLIKNPDIFANEKYRVTQADFPHAVHRIIFTAVYNLYLQGVNKPSVADINTYISQSIGAYEFFRENKGTETILQVEEMAQPSNFAYYYDKTKKMTLLRQLSAAGFDISEWYIADVLDFEKRESLNYKLEKASLQEILNSFQLKLIDLEGEFVNKENFLFESVGEGLGDLLESLKQAPEHGFRMEGEMMTTMARGARPSKVYMISAPSGVGKSRLLLSNAAKMSIPYQYDWYFQKWKHTGSSHKILFITTELEVEEVQTMLLANISGINEEHILNGGINLSPKQERVLQETIKIIEYYSDNLYIYHMPDPNIEQLNNNVRRLVMTQGFEAVIFDYIHISPTLLGQFRGTGVREDSALLMMSTALKNLANELDIFIFTATQVNASAQQSKREDDAEFGSEGMVRGARAISDKVDFAGIMRPVTGPLKDQVMPIISQQGREPNAYIDIYKNRRGKYTQVRLWIDADLGTCRFTDCFLTDEYNQLQEMKHLLFIEEEVEPLENILGGADGDK